MQIRTGIIFLVVTAMAFRVNAQDALVPLNRDYYHMLDRLDITNDKGDYFHTSHKPYRRINLSAYTAKQQTDWLVKYPERSTRPGDVYFSNGMQTNALILDNWEYFRDPGDSSLSPYGFTPGDFRYSALLKVQKKNFVLSGVPVLGFSKTWDLNNKDSLFQNVRGLQVRGSIGNKVGFYSFISENQYRYPGFYRNQVDSQGVVPGVGFFKRFKKTGHDFFMARGYVTFSPIREIAVQFGHDQNFVGDGYRSLIWSDNAKENLFLKLQTEVWKIRYMNIFSELSDVDRVIGNGEGFRKKYSAFHHLNFMLKPNLHIGVFEQIIFDRNDSSQTQGYDLNYLNPMIFYRAVEHGLNSSDNVILGMNWKWNFLRRFSFYGQFVLDEFKKDEFINRTGWWANKWALQSGIKYINAFKVRNLDLQYELNIVRPYTYAHFKKSQNYTNYNQSMAHPLGANFKEHVFIARAGYWQRIQLIGKVIYSEQGLDSSSNSFFTNGGDLSKDYLSRPKERGIQIGDGISNKVLTLEFRASYFLLNNVFIDLNYVYREQKHALNGTIKDDFLSIGLRCFLSYKSLN